MEEAVVMMVGIDKKDHKGIKMMIDGKLNIKNKIVKDYKVENVSNKVTK